MNVSRCVCMCVLKRALFPVLPLPVTAGETWTGWSQPCPCLLFLSGMWPPALRAGHTLTLLLVGLGWLPSQCSSPWWQCSNGHGGAGATYHSWVKPSEPICPWTPGSMQQRQHGETQAMEGQPYFWPFLAAQACFNLRAFAYAVFTAWTRCLIPSFLLSSVSSI